MSLDSIVIDTIIGVARDTTCYTIQIINTSETGSIWKEILKNGVTILIALIAGLIALYQVKSNIISSARIRWVEELRQDLSEFYAISLDTIYHYHETHDDKLTKEESNEMYQKYDEDFTQFNILANKIRMNLNPKEDNHNNLIKLIDKIEGMVDIDAIDNIDQALLETELKKVVDVARSILKIEWDKSKKLFRI